MISLAAVEALASELWPDALSAVVAMPDARKGERLVLVTQQQGAARGEFQSYAKAQHASELMIPSEVWHLEKLPLLGSGKVDMMALTRLVQDRAQPKPELVTRAVG
jgi:acyl-[acyl-carrier-protein]-phospholipid O-acyltransferase/long-chain-fatty-acid--[acyl-carrier-protein] ligase